MQYSPEVTRTVLRLYGGGFENLRRDEAWDSDAPLTVVEQPTYPQEIPIPFQSFLEFLSSLRFWIPKKRD